MSLRRSAAVATILATAAACLAGGSMLPVANAAVDHPQHGRSAPTTSEGERAEDSRLGDALVKPTKEQLAAAGTILDGAGDGARMTWDQRFGTPRTIYSGSGAALSGPQAGTPVEAARAFIDRNRAAFGLSAADVAALRVTRNHPLSGIDVTIIDLAQVFDGVTASRGGSMGMAVDGRGRVLTFSGSVARAADLLGSHLLTPAVALTRAGSSLGLTSLVPQVDGEVAGFSRFRTGLGAPSYVQKVAFPTADGARAAYRVLMVKKLDEAYDMVVDARSGAVLYKKSMVHHEAEGTSTRTTRAHPRAASREKVSFGPTDESPEGLRRPDGCHRRRASRRSATTPTPSRTGRTSSRRWTRRTALSLRRASSTSGSRTHWGVSECQATPPSYAQDPMRRRRTSSTSTTGSTTSSTPRVHRDGGNFQTDGGDPIMGLVQAGAISGGEPTYTGRDNAYMLTLPDGIPPWSGMFLWEPINDAFEGPCRDGDFDAGVIEHEYAHGLSNRYVGTTDGALGGHQSGSMGEGWGDWYALNHLHSNDLQDDSVSVRT